MEGEVNLLRKRMEECKLRSRSLRETARHQRDKSRQLIVACASKLQEKEAIIEQVILQTSIIYCWYNISIQYFIYHTDENGT